MRRYQQRKVTSSFVRTRVERSEIHGNLKINRRGLPKRGNVPCGHQEVEERRLSPVSTGSRVKLVKSDVKRAEENANNIRVATNVITLLQMNALDANPRR